LFYISSLLLAITSFVYTFYIFDILSFPINIFAVNFQIISFVTSYFLSIKIIAIVLGFVFAIVLIPLKFPKTLNRRVLVIYSLFVVFVFLITSPRPSVNPVLFSIRAEIVSVFQKDYQIKPLENIQITSTFSDNFDFLNKNFDTIPKIDSHYDKIIVLVMESVNYKDFTNVSKYKKQSFFTKNKSNSLFFNHYYTNNLDSYTSLLAILHSVFIPYQAYVNEQQYLFVNKKPNLVRFFNTNGFKTLFLTSYGKQQERFIPALNEWNTVKYITDFPKKFHCVTSNKIETACEDFAVFDDLLEFVSENEKVFVFQELVFGHTADWEAELKITTLDYYNNYFLALFEALQKRNLLENTLLVITSDHGPRQNTQVLANYNVPLLFVSQNIKNQIVSDLASHLDFKDLLLSVLTDSDFNCNTEKIYTIGNSNELDYGMISDSNQYIFINNRSLTVKTNQNKQKVQQFNSDFQQYLNFFKTQKDR